MSAIVNKVVQSVYQEACQARLKAYAPYSKYAVGAALKVKDQSAVIAGCNIENSAYGCSVCAERVALFKWFSARHSNDEIEFLVLVTDNEHVVAPCGMCRQVMSEFCRPDMPIYLANLQGVQKKVALQDLLPLPFNSDQLPSTKLETR